jgi:hypothetical protein
MKSPGFGTKLAVLTVFAVAMGYLEAAVVVYLRELFYPEGFGFPLKTFAPRLLYVELGRELATVIMLWTVAAISGRKFWERFGYFILLFGIWDIFYYIWLKAAINWPTSLADWDILFLLPLPWIGPVMAPVLVSLVMVAAGFLMARLFARDKDFRPTVPAWTLAVIGTAAILVSFMRDTNATLRQQPPEPYSYFLLVTGLLLYVGAFVHAYRRSISGRTS